MASDPHNPIFELAARFVNQTARHVFLTGRAGTGKTTFLKYIRETSFKKMAVVAPTGVAAINAGGTTMHSFFQLPFGPFIPAPQYGWNTEAPGYSDPNTLFRNIRFNANRRQLLLELELLIIDEISMVRADTLDAVDHILRHFRQQPDQPFGGLQVLCIGDLFQLPPVVPKEEWQLLQHHYASPFFFDAKVIRQSPPVYLELNKIYRQNEAEFIHILNNIRNNRLQPEDLERLHDFYQPDFIPPRNDNYITLTSHNARADAINQEELSKLKGPAHSFEASVTGEFSDKSFPAEKTLTLKEGAQVMLIKNDKGETRRYYNGKIAIVRKVKEDKLILEFPDEPDELVLEKETWRNIRYQYNKELDKVEEEELGTFRQYPIRLAWAITIHKSQGLTFQKAVIDAGASFAPGQVYVALSRLTSLHGLVLRSRIRPGSISTDPRVVIYTEEQMPEGAAEQELGNEQLSFITDSLLKTFHWSRFVTQLQDHYAGYSHRQIPGKSTAIQLARKWLDSALAQQEVAQKFTQQLATLLPTAEADGYQQLHQRTTAAVGYFSRELRENILHPLEEHIADVRASKKAKKYLQELKTLQAICSRRLQQVDDALKIVSGLQKGMDTTRLLFSIQEDRLNRPENKPQDRSASTGSQQEQLPSQSPDNSQGPATSPSPRQAHEPAPSPDNQQQPSPSGSPLDPQRSIPPPGKPQQPSPSGSPQGSIPPSGKPQQPSPSGSLLDPLGSIPPSGKPQKGDSNRTSLRLFKEGISIADIAARRRLSPSTIEAHLSSFIPTWEIDIKDLVSENKIKTILFAIRSVGGSALGPIKSQLGEAYSFGEIRAVIAWSRSAPTP